MIKIIILLLLILPNNIYAYEKIEPIINNDKFIGINNIININSTKELVKVETTAVKGLLFYASLNKNDKYKINLIINNKNYKYLDNSIRIKKYKFDNNRNAIYRTINKPLKKLYNYKNIDLSDKVLDKKLKSKGYKGIEELHKYYKDYYKCSKLTEKHLKKIIKGKITYHKENNSKINELAYDYYHKNILIVKNNNLNIELYLNKKYLTSAYVDYLYDLDISFYLKKL